MAEGPVCLLPVRQVVPVRAWVFYRAQVQVGRVCLPREWRDGPVRAWALCREREQVGQVCLLRVGPDAIGEGIFLLKKLCTELA
jgi:hypothetical protein